MRRILAQTRKELTQIIRDRRALGLALILPIMQIVLMGSSISLDVQDLPIVVQDLDDSPASHQLMDAFRESVTFHVIPFAVDRNPEQAFTDNRARAVLIIPEHFGRDMSRGAATPVQMMIDASDANTAKLVAGYASQVTTAFNQQNGAAMQAAPVTASMRFWYNPGRSSRKFYGPGIFVLALSLFPPLLATLAMAKEGEQKTILQVYVSSISAHEFLLGNGDPTPFIVATVLYAFCTSSFGNMIGAAIPNQAAAMQAVALGGFLLVFMLSGLIFPLQNVPIQIRWLSNFIWGRYYIEIVRDALLQGGGWPAVWWKVGVIAIIGSIFFLLGWRNLRRMQVKA
jgi:ABC-2 type transport system permease protein